MSTPAPRVPTQKSMSLLSRLLLQPAKNDESYASTMDELTTEVCTMQRSEFNDLLELACSNHVVIRGLEIFLSIVCDANDEVRTEWALSALLAEQSRIRTAVLHLREICDAFEENRYDVAVIKSLDHWPDLGSDLDMYTNTHPEKVCALMTNRFHATIAHRSWGDRLAGKWNFMVPGLPEAVEIHMGRLGQTGEQLSIASNLIRRSRVVTVADMNFRVPSAADRLMISTLQRMYRHFYFRLCDIIDSGELVESGEIDFMELEVVATNAGIWEGVATYLLIVSDYMKQYRGWGLALPYNVTSAARFDGETVHYGKSFLRVPIMPQSAKLYGSQLAGLFKRRELFSGARLSLLPWLATAAVVGQKLTGSDKGIW